MKYVRRIVYSLLLTAAVNVLPLVWFFYLTTRASLNSDWIYLPLLAAFLYVNVRPIPKDKPDRRIQRLAAGCELLRLFCVAATATILIQIAWICAISTTDGPGTGVMVVFDLLIALPLLFVLFWNGMIRVYLTSVQLGIKHRVLAALCGWIPLVNLWYLVKIIRICGDEVEFETQKWELDAVRAESEICKTKYPLLMVHWWTGIGMIWTIMVTRIDLGSAMEPVRGYSCVIVQ